MVLPDGITVVPRVHLGGNGTAGSGSGSPGNGGRPLQAPREPATKEVDDILFGEPFRYQPLDLQAEPPEPRWLVKDFIAKGDVTLLEAAEGRGKSWITMGLAVAVAESWKTFLGMPLLDHGNVLYVDQENPLDVIYSRLRKLGMTEAGAKRIHYLWDQGIKFDKEGKTFVEYAAVLKPVLVILDSLTRFHSKDEDKAGQMAELFNTGIQPLARRIGASVILIHHANKGGDVRGSTEIKASIDARLTVGPQNSDGQFRVYGQKSRRKRLDGEGVWVMIEDRPDGSVGLRSDLLSEPNF